MKRSAINTLFHVASSCFQKHDWYLPSRPRWDVTDFGLGDWQRFGLVLVNLAEEPEYCEKLMYAQKGMIGEVSTSNDDANDNFFVNPEIGRWPGIEEDEPASVRLLSEK